MLNGEYIFYVDGKEIARSNNLITKFGKRFITSYIAGMAQFNSKDIAVGIANGTDYASADSNSRLGFEFYRSPVNLGSIDVQPDGNGGYTYSVIYKTTIPQDISGIIKEVGLYPGTRTSLNSYDSRFLSTFENVIDWVDADNANPPLRSLPDVTPRIGDFMMDLKFDTADTSSTSKEYKNAVGILDISGYSTNDSISLAFNRPDTNSSEINIHFYSSSVDYFTASIDASALSTGNYIKDVSMADVFENMTGTPDPYNISHIGVELVRASASSGSRIYLDGLRVNDQDTFDPTFGLISRSILSTAIDKIAGRPIDIEYKLTLGF